MKKGQFSLDFFQLISEPGLMATVSIPLCLVVIAGQYPESSAKRTDCAALSGFPRAKWTWHLQHMGFPLFPKSLSENLKTLYFKDHTTPSES